MKLYKDWAPTQFDTKGLSASDLVNTNAEVLSDVRQWFVAPVICTRDSDNVERSNWYNQCGEVEEGDTSEYTHKEFSFNHWACGWFKILLVKPDSKAAEICIDIEKRLEQYPILNEDDVDLEDEDSNDEYGSNDDHN